MAILLASMVLFGCSGLGSGDEDVESENKYTKLWLKTNESKSDYLLFFEQFGTSQNVTEAVVELKVGNAKNSKAGLVFSLTENENETVNFYVLGVGANNTTGNPEYYIDYYTGLTPTAMSQTTTGQQMGTATPQEVVSLETGGTDMDGKGYAVDSFGAMKAYVKIKVDEDANTITVQLAPTENNYNLTKSISHATYNSTASNPKGGIGAYGMLRPAAATEDSVTTTNSYIVIESKPSRGLLAADAE